MVPIEQENVLTKVKYLTHTLADLDFIMNNLLKSLLKQVDDDSHKYIISVLTDVEINYRKQIFGLLENVGNNYVEQSKRRK